LTAFKVAELGVRMKYRTPAQGRWKALTVDWIRAGLKHTGKTRSGLAKALGRSPSAVTDLLNGHRRLRADEIAIVAEYLGIEPPRLLGGGVKPLAPKAPLIGYIGAGAVAHFYAEGQGPYEEIDAPHDARPQTVAVQVRGHSLGPLFDNWLIFYDDVRNPPDDSLIGRMCVCGLSDGRVLIKALKKSPATGLWNLLSNTEPPIYDCAVDWAAPVREMRPR
jgi:transcriptional regulator with XRE-family HTH domain